MTKVRDMAKETDQQKWNEVKPYVELGIATLILLANVLQGRSAPNPAFYFDETGFLLDEFEKRRGWKEDDNTDPIECNSG